ncbi:MAG: 3',5'-cyclic-nucleotide phosphodiesterase [Thermodesulfovibrionia bacterium]|nr:3',5'-cyclic-nucleotide phosphodiesterase [Thermodesulfovibrionia bacterium]
MKIQVLGCSATELPKSNLPSFLIDGKILLDAGTIGTALNESEQRKIKHILLTHAHLDHIKDIPFFADNISMTNKKYYVTITSIPEVIHALKNNLLNDIVWPDFTKIPTAANPVIRIKKINAGKTFTIDGYDFTAYKVNHVVPAVGYLIENKRKKRLLYIGDTGPSNAIWKSLYKTRIHYLIIEVSFPNKFEDLALKTRHLTPRLLAREMEKLRNVPDNICIIHFKPRYKDKIKEEIKKIGIHNIKILKDGERFEL